MGIRILNLSDARDRAELMALRDRLATGGLVGAKGTAVDVPAAVREIIADVQARGDAAVVDATERIHGVRPARGDLRVAGGRIQSARAQADKDFLALVGRAAGNIRAFQRQILLKAPPPLRRGGREFSLRYVPVDRLAVYVPGGAALYPSTVLMTVVPAQVAGVGRIALVSPPGAGGAIAPMVLALAGELGVGEVYCAAGVAALAALAIGTDTFPRVDMIAGPGSAFVTEAKRQLFGRVGIDSLAGPSEVLILADETAPADWLAADLLAQAEHDPGSAVLVTTSPDLARRVAAAIAEQLPALERRSAVEKALAEYSGIAVARDLDEACRLADEFAPEHLQIVTADDEAVLARVRNAGAVFLGAHSPVPLGDYYAGPSHVLPTGGTARFFSALSANAFLKAVSVIRYDAAALAEDARDVADFARREGLTAHARAVEMRKQRLPHGDAERQREDGNDEKRQGGPAPGE